MASQIVDIFGIISGLAASGGLIYTAISFSRDRIAKETQLSESVFKEIRELEMKLNEIPSGNIDQMSTWVSSFFNTLEWLAFLINEKKIKDQKLTDFFKTAVVRYYEDVFVKYYQDINPKIINDRTAFPEFKKLYKKFNNQV